MYMKQFHIGCDSVKNLDILCIILLNISNNLSRY